MTPITRRPFLGTAVPSSREPLLEAQLPPIRARAHVSPNFGWIFSPGEERVIRTSKAEEPFDTEPVGFYTLRFI